MKILTPPFEAAVIGTSAGGIRALLFLLSQLNQSLPLPILIVQHLPPSFKSNLASFLNQHCALTVVEVEDEASICPGHVYLAPPNYHLLVESKIQLRLSVEEKVNYSRPSVDVLFESAANIYAERLIGIILSGANQDGAKGLKRIQQAGGLVIIQDPENAEFNEMPLAAIAMTEPDYVLDLFAIEEILNSVSQQVMENSCVSST